MVVPADPVGDHATAKFAAQGVVAVAEVALGVGRARQQQLLQDKGQQPQLKGFGVLAGR